MKHLFSMLRQLDVLRQAQRHIARLIWIIPVGLGLVLLTGARGGLFEITKQLEIFNTLFKELSLNYVDETSPAQLMDKAITGMLEGLDPYTVFWTEQDLLRLLQCLENQTEVTLIHLEKMIGQMKIGQKG